MRRFRFQLQPVLDLAQQEEELREAELRVLLAGKAELEKEKSDVLERIQSTRADLRNRGEILSEEIELYDRFISSLDRQSEMLTARISGLEAKIRSKKREVLESTKKRKTLDRLRERKHAEYSQEMDRSAQQEADELHLSRMRR